ncbi:MAG: hypothetical protein K8S14_07925 [Actinomycetia bacterium]|nr:hypothetical protein [Actinomycetes bacterium]
MSEKMTDKTHPHADLIERIAVALWKGSNSIQKLTQKLNEDPELIQSLLNEIIQVKGAVKRLENGSEQYFLTEDGKRDAKFIAIALGEYELSPLNIEDKDLKLTHKQILLLLEKTTKETPIEIRRSFLNKYPQENLPRKHFWGRAHT